MQPNKTIRIPSNLAAKIQQYDDNKQTTLYLTVFQCTKELSYIIDVNIYKSELLPTYMGSEYKFYQQEQTITKQNKKQVLEKYTICQTDQLNQLFQNFIIINLNIDSFIGIPIQLIGYSVQLDKKDKQNMEVKRIDQVLTLCRAQAKQIWKKYRTQYCKSLQQKKQKDKLIFLTYQIMPLLQFQVSILISPLINNNFSRKIQQCVSFHTCYPILFENKQMNDEKQIANKVDLFIKQKLNIQQFQNKICKVPILNCTRANPKKIFNPHVFAKYVKKQKFEVIMVKGMYEYYHYGDQNFHDNGWGCAYRALQTLISWMNLQSYTEKIHNMMSITEIQEKLDTFDRSRKLKGSSTWIGATQISWIIPTITIPSINCKILHISDGKQVLQKCQQFKNHFLTSGCPIMYGGGEFAYTIVGMHYNWKLGQCDFLILDPHYTGEDDYGKIIQKKGLVWKKPQQMFKKGVFYNFCLPIIK